MRPARPPSSERALARLAGRARNVERRIGDLIEWDDDGTSGVGVFGAVVATTVAGLGTPYDGKIGLVRVDDDSPYGYLPVIYDAQAAKWVSQRIPGPTIAGFSNVTTTATSWTRPTEAAANRAQIGAAVNFYNAGLVLEASLALAMFNSGSNATEARLSVVEFNDGDTTAAALWNTVSTLSHTGTTNTFKYFGWTAFTVAAPAKNLAQLVIEIQVAAGTGTFSNATSEFRWVSA